MSTTPNYGKGIYTPSAWGSRYHSRRENEVFGAGAAGPGKALSLETPIPTPVGFRLLGSLHTGDIVYNIHGEPVKIIAETETFIDRECFLVRCCGQKIVADAEHQWVMDNGLIKSTKEIFNSPFKFFVPASLPVQMDKKAYILDPYVLGVCLIRGQPKDRSKFTTWDPELYSTLKAVGYTLDDVSYQIAQIKERKDLINELVNPDSRRIPHHYMLGSFNQRMALVEGIMDGGNGRGPCVPKEDLPFLHDFFSLAASLGLGPKLCKTRFSNKWYLNIQSLKYRCSRFAGQRIGAYKKMKLRDGITSVKPFKSVPTKCIQVSGGGTFLVTAAYIPTHNSMVLLADPLEQVWVEHLRCQQEKVPETFPENIKQLIEHNPLRWGKSEGWILHMRRTMPRLEETIQRSHRMFKEIDPDAEWNDKKSTWTFSSGIKYQFGHCKDRTDYNNYLGKQYSYLGWDELVEFNKEQYDFISSRLRTGDNVLAHFLKNRSMSNPRLSGNKGEDISIDDPAWVKRYFVDVCPEGNKIIRKKIVRRDGTVEYVTRLYLPATLYDNPDPVFVKQYEAQLLARPKHIRDVYLFGKWDSVMGSFLEDTWNPTIHVCKPFKIPQSWPIFRSMDWGYRSNGIVGWYAVDPEGTAYKFWETVFKEKTATYVAEQIIKPFEEKNKLWDTMKGSKIIGPADPQIKEERGESARTKYMEFVEAGVDWVNADKKSREVNAEVLVARLRDHSNFTKAPGLIFFENCKTSIQTIPALEVDHSNPEVPQKGGWDHAWDEVSYAMQYAKQSGMDAPQYKPLHNGEDQEDEDMTENRGTWGYW